MATRKIVHIDEEKCDGCGQCIPSCEEGAIQLIDGKARLVKDIYCDGLGACLGTCPQGAITIDEREADSFDIHAAHQHVERLKHAEAKPRPAPAGGCPGSLARSLQPQAAAPAAEPSASTPSTLQNWPLQLHLVPPSAPYFQGGDLLFAADCVGFALPDFHSALLRGKQLIIACPKLDDTHAYLDKLVAIFQNNAVHSVEIARMEVPCCLGLQRLIETAIDKAGVDVPVAVTVVGIDGSVVAHTE